MAGKSRFKITERLIDGISVEGKPCSKCDTWKPLTEYRKAKNGLGGKVACCPQCERAYRESNKERILERRRRYREENKEAILAYMRKYRVENADAVSESKRASRLKKLDVYKERHRQYYLKNVEKIKDTARKHRDFRNCTPNTLTDMQREEIMRTFNYSCALTGSTDDLHLDHVIPVSVSNVGTVFENIIPLSGGLNRSKNNGNIFDWFETKREFYGLSQPKFDLLISYLAEINGMGVMEYITYYDSCFLKE